ncbi:MAG: class I SAM-dependent methyltransferase [Bacteriovoracaceae bacterium]|jgi:ubiquinone/menaquinone biosynthesis C-methylase UbiE|nr:class I SAM-dependent methyltransferase [Bacteriovoracaceae bacterium]
MFSKELIRDVQYKTSSNLQSRVGLHQQFTRINKNFWPLLASKYPWKNSKEILEIGCGTGIFWDTALKKLNENSCVTLTDISSGMLETTRDRIKDHRFRFSQFDIDTPNIASQFDLVIAHFMLYHSGNPKQALMSIKGMLTPEGKASLATLGDLHMKRIDDFIKSLIKENKLNYQITEQSSIDRFNESVADKLITEVFNSYEKYEIDDYLDVTDPAPLAEYCKSMMKYQALDEPFFQLLFEGLSNEIEKLGKFVIPKRVVFYIAH